MTENYFASSAINPTSVSMKLLHFEKVDFDNSVEIQSKNLQTVPWCQKNFYADKDLALCTVNINIPYVGNIYNNINNSWMSSKIVLFLDDEPIYTGEFNSHTTNLLRPLSITADKPYLKAGQHKISLKACITDNGTGKLNIPHFNLSNIENTVEPKNFAIIKIIGFY